MGALQQTKYCDLGGDLSSCGIKIFTGNIQTIVFVHILNAVYKGP